MLNRLKLQTLKCAAASDRRNRAAERPYLLHPSGPSIALFVPAQLNSGQNRRHRGEFTLAKARGLAEFAVPLGESGALKRKGPITRREENVA